MNRAEFDAYLACFNARDYDGAQRYFSDDVVLKFAGYEIIGRRAFTEFYRFFHEYVNERVLVRQYAGDRENIIIDAVVRIEGRKILPPETLQQKGFSRLKVPEKGESIEIPHFIHYRIVNGKFAEIRCVIKE